MKSFRSKPVGWVKDSYRHYLAAKFGSAPRRYSATVGSQLSLETSTIPSYRPRTAFGGFLKGLTTEHKLRRLADVQKGAAEFERRRDLAKEAANGPLNAAERLKMEQAIAVASRRSRNQPAIQIVDKAWAGIAKSVADNRLDEINERMREISEEMKITTDPIVAANLRREYGALEVAKRDATEYQSNARNLVGHLEEGKRTNLPQRELDIAKDAVEAFDVSDAPEKMYGYLDTIIGGGTKNIMERARGKVDNPQQSDNVQQQEVVLVEKPVSNERLEWDVVKNGIEKAGVARDQIKGVKGDSEKVDLSDVEALEVAAADTDEARMQRDIGKATTASKMGDLKQQVERESMRKQKKKAEIITGPQADVMTSKIKEVEEFLMSQGAKSAVFDDGKILAVYGGGNEVKYGANLNSPEAVDNLLKVMKLQGLPKKSRKVVVKKAVERVQDNNRSASEIMHEEMEKRRSEKRAVTGFDPMQMGRMDEENYARKVSFKNVGRFVW